ncbi:hypothetical protein CKO28_15785 [Rhodovibrio sodomensis]|uniref:HD Cas3-type domain-containing protein n=1 Tax=Rhodovibrio sodomensis TaxID=1088 RepID=A0ABS1DJE7_9PROT|nr:CRISPR-associated helicase Cas3' [Rhodovibrio sodomensis]MBK1669500.1 hypothetical protein [Rhodovibrio sodomensis]
MQIDLKPLITGYWAKARAPQGAAQRWHPFLWHSFDVAACAEALLLQHEVLAARIRALAGRTDVIALVTALALIHDLGKLSRFQEQAPEDVRTTTGQTHTRRRLAQSVRHTDTGLILWSEYLRERLPLDFDTRYVLDRLLPGVFGHHGVPAFDHGSTSARSILEGETTPDDRAAAETLATYALDRFVANQDTLTAPLARLSDDQAGRLSFLLAATVNLADWLGSNTERFPYTSPTHTPEAYWRDFARPQAAKAVAASGVIPAQPTDATSFVDLFPARSPRPLQALADTLRLPSNQGLIMVEDVTGSGKTEAADVLAARMARAGLGRGVYIALPTTATADGMAKRHAAMYDRLFETGASPSLTLVHSGPGSAGVLDAGVDEARIWMGGDRRRQLMADVAVGTVDQALLAALPARFASARLFGLAPKVLVVDEVHAHDDYTGRLLCGLIRLHAALGGSAILLSATLTADLKQQLAAAFADGAGWSEPDSAHIATSSYPAVTVVDSQETRVVPVDAPTGAHRAIPVAVTEDMDAARSHLLAAARAGFCALWMRNTVDDAIAAYEDLAAEHDDVTLLHARFPAARRAEIEDDVIRRFGPVSDSATRAGAIVVGTQVLEQSLDLDFDAMVCDLKPMDSLIQSAGRLQRHARDADGTPRDDGGATHVTRRPYGCTAQRSTQFRQKTGTSTCSAVPPSSIPRSAGSGVPPSSCIFAVKSDRPRSCAILSRPRFPPTIRICLTALPLLRTTL